MKNLLIEVGTKTLESLVGKIKFFSPQKGYGYIEVDGKEDVWFGWSALQMVAEGISHPKAGDPLNLKLHTPRGGDSVVFTQPEFRKCWETSTVLSRFHYDKMVKRMAERPVFRVMRKSRNFGNRTFRKWNEHFTGTMQELCAKYPRLEANDQLAPECWVDTHIFQNRWEKKTGTGWVECSDPRPLPRNVTGIEVRVTEVENGLGEQRFNGHLGGLLECPHDAFVGDQFVFEIRIPGKEGRNEFTEVGDPRPWRQPKASKQNTKAQPVTAGTQPDRKVAEKAGVPAPEAMPKSGKLRPMVLTDLSALYLPGTKQPEPAERAPKPETRLKPALQVKKTSGVAQLQWPE